MRRALTLSLAAIAALLLPATAEAATPILVQLERGVTAAERADVRDDAGVQRVRAADLPRSELVRVTDGDRASALRALNRDPDVAWAAPNVPFRSMTSDTYWGQLWALQAAGPDLEAPAAWATFGSTAPGNGQKIAVVDTGADLDHEDLQGGALLSGYDYVNGDSVPDDDQYHGTHVTGIIAARANNGIGVAGIAPGAQVEPLKVLDSAGDGTLEDILSAFDDAGADGIPIVSASLGGEHVAPTSPEATAFRNAFNSVLTMHPGTLYVVAAGNEHANDDAAPSYPCAATASNLLCVGATDSNDQPACFSNVGQTTVDLFAPGVDILSTIPSGYGYLSGTSMATPFVAGIAALARQANPSLAGATLAAHLRASVDPVPSLAALSVSGGRIDALRAVGGTSAKGAGASGAWTMCAGDPDADADGVPDAADLCPTKAGPGRPDGCPVAAPATITPTPTPSPTTPTTPIAQPVVSDRDGDGRADAADACPAEAAASANGCPLPAVRSLSVKVAKRRVRARVRTDRAATVTIKLERRRCSRGHCRWKRVTTRRAATRSNTVSLSKRASRGRYRLSVSVASAAGRGKSARRTFSVH